jgi:hypothetical protein
MSRGFWDHYPKKFWVESDWQAWERAGRPKVPPHLDLQPPVPVQMGNTPVIPPALSVTSLYVKPRRRGVGAQSRAVDELLEKLGVR